MKIKKRKDGIDRSILKDFMKSSIKYSSIDVKSMKKFNENQKKKRRNKIDSSILKDFVKSSIYQKILLFEQRKIDWEFNEDKKKKRKEGEKEMQKLEVT